MFGNYVDRYCIKTPVCIFCVKDGVKTAQVNWQTHNQIFFSFLFTVHLLNLWYMYFYSNSFLTPPPQKKRNKTNHFRDINNYLWYMNIFTSAYFFLTPPNIIKPLKLKAQLGTCVSFSLSLYLVKICLYGFFYALPYISPKETMHQPNILWAATWNVICDKS